jgi:hypothetical protein
METTRLTDYQLYALSLNGRLPARIREAVAREVEGRAWTEDQIKLLELEHLSLFYPRPDEPLPSWAKLLVMLFAYPHTILIAWMTPFFHWLGPFWRPGAIMLAAVAIFPAKFLSRGEKQKWRDYWRAFMLGFAVWGIIYMIIIALLG